MLTKQAAERIATNYYRKGQQLAMIRSGLVKEAKAKEQVARLLKEYAALLGGSAGLAAYMKSGPAMDAILGHDTVRRHLLDYPLVAGSALGGHKLTKKLLNKLSK